MSLDGGATFQDGFKRAQDRSTFAPVHLNHEDKGKSGCNCFRNLDDGRVAFFAARPINAGEEMCFDYGASYWEGREGKKI
jgi:SET domain-containing protein